MSGERERAARLRGEHIVNLVEYLQGIRAKFDESKGYNAAFAAAHDEVLAAIVGDAHRRVTIVAGYDDICDCGVCPNRREECDSAAYRENDRRIAARYGVSVGAEYRAGELIMLVTRTSFLAERDEMATRLPGIAIMPSRVVLGSVYFGSEISEKDSFAVMDAFAEAGGNFIDTAHIYAAWLVNGVGASERTVGKWVRARGKRDSFIVGTKGAHPPLDAAEKVGRCSRADLEKDLGESLGRLGFDYVDLYWLHFDEPTRPVGEIIESLAEIKRSGRIRAYGASNWKTERIEAANEFAKANGLPPFAASQPWFSLGAVANAPKAQGPTAEVDDPLWRWHVASGLPMIPYSSQANGYFGEENVAWAKSGFQGEAKRAASFDSPANRRRLTRAIELAERKGCTANQLALAYLLNQPFAIFPIIGTGNPEHAREALGAVGAALTAEERAYLLG